MPGEPKTLILSDTHLGRPGRVTVESLRPLWQGFDRLIINGDAAELQLPDYRAAGAKAVEQLQHAVAKDGSELTLISGNHDAYLSDHRYLRLLGGRVLLTHGDVLHRSIVPWSRQAKVLALLHTEAMENATDAQRRCIDFCHELSQHLAHREMMGLGAVGRPVGMSLRSAALHPIKVAKVLAYWRSIPELTHRFAQRYCPDAELIVLGHTHRQGIWEKGGRTILNTGSYDLPGRPRAVMIEGDRLCVRRVKWIGGHYRIAERALYSCTFTAQSTDQTEPIPKPLGQPIAA